MDANPGLVGSIGRQTEEKQIKTIRKPYRKTDKKGSIAPLLLRIHSLWTTARPIARTTVSGLSGRAVSCAHRKTCLKVWEKIFCEDIPKDIFKFCCKLRAEGKVSTLKDRVVA